MTITDQLREQLSDYGYTYNGIPIIELGEDAEQVITFGHVDKVAFAHAYDAYLQEVLGETLTEYQQVSIEQFADDTQHCKARIRYLDRFPDDEYQVIVDRDGDMEVTVRNNY